MIGRRLLIADDNRKLQTVLRALAEQAGFEVVQAETGADIYKTVLAHRFDLIVLDINFPDADGRDVLARLKANPRTASIPVLVWSGRDPDSDRRIALSLGAEDYVEKAGVRDLIPKIERVLARLKEQS